MYSMGDVPVAVVFLFGLLQLYPGDVPIGQ